jgi:hypothetical protein
MTDRTWVCLLVAVGLVLAPLTIDAGGSYKWVDEHGNVTYSDRPPQPGQGRPMAPDAAPTTDAAPAPELKTLDARPVLPLDTRAAPAPDTRPATGPPEPMKAAAPPAVIPRTGPTKVDDLLELSGTRAQLVGLVRTIAGEIRPAPATMSAKDLAAVDRVLARTLRAETVYALLRVALLPNIDRTNLEATAAWLRTPLARKVVALEIASAEPAAQQRVAEFVAALTSNPPTQRRAELVRHLDWATASTETSADILAAVARGITMAVSAAGPAEQRLRPGQIEDRVAQVRARANEGLREAQMASALYAYRDLTDDELAAYVLFSASEAGRWYNVAMRKALVSALNRAVEQTATELVRTVPLERWAHAAPPAQAGSAVPTRPGAAPVQPRDTPARPGVK